MRRILWLAVVVLSLGATARTAQSQNWQTLSIPTTLKDVAIWGSVWVLGTSGQAYVWTSSGWSPHSTPVQGAESIEVGPDQRPFVNEGNRWTLLRSTGNGWSTLPGNAYRPGMDARNYPWTRIGSARVFHYFDGSGWQRGDFSFGEMITFNAGGIAAAIGNGGLAHRLTNGQLRSLGGETATDIAIDDGTRIWTVGHRDGRVHRHDGSGWTSYQLPGQVQASRIAVTGQGQPFVVGTDGQLYTCTDCSGGVPPPPPPPPEKNRPPNLPTVPTGTWEPPVNVPSGSSVQLTWRDNGDPDGDALTFGVYVQQWTPGASQWVPSAAFRDASGNPTAVWVNGTSYTFTAQAGLQPGTYYYWGVTVCEVGRTADQPCFFSGWSWFRTS